MSNNLSPSETMMSLITHIHSDKLTPDTKAVTIENRIITKRQYINIQESAALYNIRIIRAIGTLTRSYYPWILKQWKTSLAYGLVYIVVFFTMHTGIPCQLMSGLVVAYVLT